MHGNDEVVIAITLAAGTCTNHDVDHYYLNYMLPLMTPLSKLLSKQSGRKSCMLHSSDRVGIIATIISPA